MKIAFSMSLIIFLLSITYFAVKINRVKASDTIYIRADGSIEPLSANITSVDNVTYTFTGNVSDGIVAERNDTIIDGDEYTLQGSGVGVGLNLTIVHNITIRNMNIKNFEVGFRLEASSKISIQGNNITNNKDEGVYFRSSSNNTISGNHITANKLSAVQLSFYSNNNTVSGNTITNSSSGVYVDNSNYNTISGNHITAINKLSGVGLSFFANYNTVSGNHITNNDKGVGIFYSSNNTVSGNHITNNDKGVSLESSNYTTVSGNHITANNEYGVILSYFNNYNTVSENNITNNDYGVQLFFYDNNYNTISGNNISYNSYGIWVEESDYNEFYHNYIDNINQTYVEPGYANIWDKGYPTGGNYWSDYKDKYPNATEIDESGIWDTPYIIDELNQDNYPIVPEFPSLIVLPLFMITTIFVAIMYKRKHSLS